MDLRRGATPDNGDFRAPADKPMAARTAARSWAVIKFVLAVLLLPWALLVILLDWAHLMVIFAFGAVLLYVGVAHWQSYDWRMTLLTLGAGLALTFGTLLYARDKVRGHV